MKRRSDRTKNRRAPATTRITPRHRRARSARGLEAALTRLRRAVAVTVSRADAVLASSDAIAALSADRAKEMLIRSLLDDGVLAALYSLSPSDATSTALRMHARWLRERLGLEPLYEQGQVLEIPAARLSAFDLVDGAGAHLSDICRISILAAGWKQGERVLRKPVASVGGTSQGLSAIPIPRAGKHGSGSP